MSNVRVSRVGLSAAMTAALLVVVDMKPSDASQPRFGEQASNELRGLLDLDTHVALNERQTDQAARQFDLRRASLDCTMGRQMADRLSIPIVFCGEYRTEGNQIVYNSITAPSSPFPRARSSAQRKVPLRRIAPAMPPSGSVSSS
jgi:hypothetical protein